MSKKLVNLPLYQRAEKELTQRLISGYWRVGHRLPSEVMLAEEMGVSQGTIRKALISLERRGLLNRGPSRGTIVAGTTEEEALFAFFRMRDANGKLVVPSVLSETVTIEEPRDQDLDDFGAETTSVSTIHRVRISDGRPFVVDLIRLNGALTMGIEDHAPLPGSLYPFLSDKFSVTIMKAEERLTAVVADGELAAALGCPIGQPLLKCSRLAFDLSDRCVERRLSFYLTEFSEYQVELVRGKNTSSDVF